MFFALFFLIPVLAFSTDNNHFKLKNHSDVYMVPIAVGFLSTSLIAAHIYAPEIYSWKTNTISQLAAQNYNNAWIMRAGFIGFGLLISGAATWDLIAGGKHWAQTVPLIAYGTSIALTGIFSAAPFEGGVQFSEKEDNLHGMFANIAGLAFTAAMLGHALTEDDTQRRILYFSGMAFVIFSSAMFKIQPEYQGIWQRVLWTGSLSWLTVSFSF